MRDALRVMSPDAPTASSQPAASMRLQRLMTDAGRHVPLYRRLWAASGIDVDHLRSRGISSACRWLDKAALRSCRPADRIHGKRRDIHLAEELSSGSSGEPLAVFKDRAAQLRRRWAFLRALLACGYRPGQRCLLLTSRRSAKWPTVARWSYASIGEDTATLASQCRCPAAGRAVRPAFDTGTAGRATGSTDAATGRAAPGHLEGGTVDATAPRNARAGIRRTRSPISTACPNSVSSHTVLPGIRRFTPARSSLMLEFFPIAGEPSVERLVVTDLAERTSPWIRYDTGTSSGATRSLPGARSWSLPGGPWTASCCRTAAGFSLPARRPARARARPAGVRGRAASRSFP